MRPIWRLIKLVFPYRKWIGLSILLGTLTIGSSIGLMMASAFIISMAALHPSIAELQVAIVGVRFFGMSRGVFRYLERLISHETTFRLLSHFRVRFYQALEPLIPAQLWHLRSAELLQRIIADIHSLENFFVRVMAPPAISALTAIIMAGLLYSFAPHFALIFLIFYGLAATAIPYLSIQLTRGMGSKITLLKNALNSAVLDQLNGLADLLVNQQLKSQQAKIEHINRQLSKLQQHMSTIEALHQGFVTLLMFGAIVVTLTTGIQMVQEGLLNGVYLAVLVLGIMAAFEGVFPLPQMAQILEQNSAAGQRLFEIIEHPVAFKDPAQPLPFPKQQPIHLKTRNLEFTYPGATAPALYNVNLDIPYGSKMAVVGPSGSGKSTLAQLFIRLYDYPKGHILLNEMELKHFKQSDIREHLSYASQSFHLFTGTIAENLRMIKPGHPEALYLEILRLVELHTLTTDPGELLNYWIGEHGKRLSGGQAQRLALAQVLLKNSPIFILDEVTANLDVETEQKILTNIFNHFQDRTIINITHRLSNMEVYEQIVVLKDGQLVGKGTHQQLLKENAIYRHMYSVFQESLLFF